MARWEGTFNTPMSEASTPGILHNYYHSISFIVFQLHSLNQCYCKSKLYIVFFTTRNYIVRKDNCMQFLWQNLKYHRWTDVVGEVPCSHFSLFPWDLYCFSVLNISSSQCVCGCLCVCIKEICVMCALPHYFPSLKETKPTPGNWVYIIVIYFPSTEVMRTYWWWWVARVSGGLTLKCTLNSILIMSYKIGFTESNSQTLTEASLD